MKKHLAALYLGLGLLSPGLALADNSTAAEALFDEGRRLFEEGQYEQACPKFAESQRLEKATGTLLNLANCYEKTGRLATAWATWRAAASRAAREKQAPREEHARKKAKELKGRLARITLVVPQEARVDGLTIDQNGTPQSEGLWGTPIPVDAGRYAFVVTAPGYLSFETSVEILDGQSQSVEIPQLQQAPNTAAVPSSTTSTDSPPDDTEDRTSSNSNMKTWGIALTSAGAASLAVGTYFGFDAINKNKESKADCRPEDSNLCTPEGESTRDKALSAGTASTILIGFGLAAATSGIVMIVAAPSAQTQVAAVPTPGGGALFFQGSF